MFELGAGDACYVPIGDRHEYRNHGSGLAEAIAGIAPPTCREPRVGIDVGGTKIAAGVVDTGSGEVLRSERVPTAARARRRGRARRLRRSGGTAGRRRLPVGVGICEVVDLDGRVTSAETVDWRGLDVASAFGAASVTVESDVRAAALAEARFGAGAGLGSFLYAGVGTGASACLVAGRAGRTAARAGTRSCSARHRWSGWPAGRSSATARTIPPPVSRRLPPSGGSWRCS